LLLYNSNLSYFVYIIIFYSILQFVNGCVNILNKDADINCPMSLPCNTQIIVNLIELDVYSELRFHGAIYSQLLDRECFMSEFV